MGPALFRAIQGMVPDTILSKQIDCTYSKDNVTVVWLNIMVGFRSVLAPIGGPFFMVVISDRWRIVGGYAHAKEFPPNIYVGIST